jgi:hypothetical protein
MQYAPVNEPGEVGCNRRQGYRFYIELLILSPNIMGGEYVLSESVNYKISNTV